MATKEAESARAAERLEEATKLRTFYGQRIASLARALTLAGSPGIERRSRTHQTTVTTWLGKQKIVAHVEELSPGWRVGSYTWGYNARDLDVRLPEAVYLYRTSYETLSTFVLENGHVVYDGTIDGRNVSLTGGQVEILLTLAAIAKRYTVDLPWDVEEALAKVEFES